MITPKEKAIIVSMIANGCEFRKEMAIINNKEYDIDKLNRIVKVADEALEKQIPKKPTPTDEQHIRYLMSYVCPLCGHHFIGTGIASYCYHCGQALDWNAHPTEKGGAEE